MNGVGGYCANDGDESTTSSEANDDDFGTDPRSGPMGGKTMVVGGKTVAAGGKTMKGITGDCEDENEDENDSDSVDTGADQTSIDAEGEDGDMEVEEEEEEEGHVDDEETEDEEEDGVFQQQQQQEEEQWQTRKKDSPPLPTRGKGPVSGKTPSHSHLHANVNANAPRPDHPQQRLPSTGTDQSQLEAWKEVHAALTRAVLVAREAIAAKKLQRRFWLETICANLKHPDEAVVAVAAASSAGTESSGTGVFDPTDPPTELPLLKTHSVWIKPDQRKKKRGSQKNKSSSLLSSSSPVPGDGNDTGPTGGASPSLHTEGRAAKRQKTSTRRAVLASDGSKPLLSLLKGNKASLRGKARAKKAPPAKGAALVKKRKRALLPTKAKKAAEASASAELSAGNSETNPPAGKHKPKPKIRLSMKSPSGSRASVPTLSVFQDDSEEEDDHETEDKRKGHESLRHRDADEKGSSYYSFSLKTDSDDDNDDESIHHNNSDDSDGDNAKQGNAAETETEDSSAGENEKNDEKNGSSNNSGADDDDDDNDRSLQARGSNEGWNSAPAGENATGTLPSESPAEGSAATGGACPATVRREEADPPGRSDGGSDSDGGAGLSADAARGYGVFGAGDSSDDEDDIPF